MNRALVEAATHPDALAAITAEMGWEVYERAIVAKELAERLQGAYAAYPKGGTFRDFQPFKDDALLRSRLGGQGPVYDLPDGTTGPFGAEITRIALPAHWSQGLSGEEVVTVTPEPDGLMLSLGEVRFQYSRAGLTRLKG